MNNGLTLFAALLLGLAASGHCLVMCGGISGALGHVPPWLAAVGMSVSSLVVVLNATRIGRRQPILAEAAPREALA